MRGLIPAHMMAEIEHRTGLRMVDMVDIFTGPSTGAILNAALTLRNPDDPDRPKYRARHMVRFYEREGLKIFPPDSFRSFRGLVHDFNNRMMRISQLNRIFKHGHYDPSHLGQALRALFGSASLHDSLRSLIIPCYNIDGEQLMALSEDDENEDAKVHTKNNVIDTGGHAMWLKNIVNAPRRRKTPDISLYNAVMSSTAAPTFFPCHHFTMRDPQTSHVRTFSAIDGSIFDNPCISYHGAIRPHIPDGMDLTMIALGTGQTTRSIKKEEWNQYGSLGYVDPVNDLPLINIFFHAPESALLESFADELGDNFYNFNKSLIYGRENHDWPDVQIDNADPENLKKMRNFAQSIIEDKEKDFDKVCDILVQNYDNKKDKSWLDSIKDSLAS